MEMWRPKMEEEEEEEEERRKKTKWPWMKSSQLLEFQVQALVYRYIEAGLRVPSHLLVPIYNSLARSSSSLSSNYFLHHNHHSSSLLNGFNHNPVDPEPTRCRRTDGKKWRCSYTVLPFQKYCERHMHRGRKRSRKLVESSSSSSSTNITSSTKLENSNNNPSNVTVASLASPGASDYVTCPPLAITNKSASHGDKIMEMTYDDVIKQREPSSCVQAVPVQGDEKLLLSVQKFFPEVSDNSLVATKKLSSNTKSDIIPRSREWKTNMNDDERGRCRRTDGKKWRCSKDAISGQKYCDKHMHRGIKKKKHQVNTGFTPMTVKTPARSVSILGIPHSIQVSDEKSNSNCSTDTTITDTALRGDEEEEDNEEVLSLCCSAGV